ncbi:MAG: hypothetical protein ACQERC_07260 [Bacteroidota bacterium]
MFGLITENTLPKPMITKYILKPENQSNDSVFKAIENELSGSYKLIRLSESRMKIKRLYEFQSNGWEVIMKQLNLKDSGCFEINDNNISYIPTVAKPVIFWTLMSTIVFFILWKLFQISLSISLITIIVPSIIGWTVGHYNLKKFLNHELDMIDKRLNHNIN